jgi:hypothetical protein
MPPSAIPTSLRSFPLLCWGMNALAPGSVLLLRTPSALAAAVTTVLAALIAGEIGGGTRAQFVAATCTWPELWSHLTHYDQLE